MNIENLKDNLNNVTGNIKNKIWLTTLLLISTTVLIVILWIIITLSSKGFYKGIYVENIDVSGLTIDKAKSIVEANLYGANQDSTMKNNNDLILKFGKTSWVIPAIDYSLSFLTNKVLQDAYRIGRTGNVFNRIRQIIDLKIKNEVFYSGVSFNRSYIRKTLLNIKARIDKEGKDAAVFYDNGVIKKEKEVKGRFLDVDKNLKLIESKLVARNFQGVELEVIEKSPNIVYNDIVNIDGVLSSFSTDFNANDYNRSENIRLASKKINGILLMPGDIYSMNKAVGPRTSKNGYKDAKIILNNQYVDGIGGGVCQLTTTLYNAVLKSKLEVIERQHHSIPSIYVGPGQDATIADNSIDFKFQNNKEHPILISAEATSGIIRIRIIGEKDNNTYTVKLVSDVIEVFPSTEVEYIIDNSVPDYEQVIIQKPIRGLRAVLYRKTYDEKGVLIETEKISDDTYKPTNAKIKVNQNFIIDKAVESTGDQIY